MLMPFTPLGALMLSSLSNLLNWLCNVLLCRLTIVSPSWSPSLRKYSQIELNDQQIHSQTIKCISLRILVSVCSLPSITITITLHFLNGNLSFQTKTRIIRKYSVKIQVLVWPLDHMKCLIHSPHLFFLCLGNPERFKERTMARIIFWQACQCGLFFISWTELDWETCDFY